MATKKFDDFDDCIKSFKDSQEDLSDNCKSSKLEQRRRIEDMMEEKLLRDELKEFDFIED